MIENLDRLKELLNRINAELDGLETLFGGITEKTEDCVIKEECILDTVNINLQKADYALCVLERINNMLRGGRK